LRELKLYQCEICGTQYADKINAKTCEESHKIPKKILGCKYLSYKQNQLGYPQKISIVFEDGKVVEYHR